MSDDPIIQQAADVIAIEIDSLTNASTIHDAVWLEAVTGNSVAALAAAGLLVTSEQRAVLDAADKWRFATPEVDDVITEQKLIAAVDDLRAVTRCDFDSQCAATPKDDE